MTRTHPAPKLPPPASLAEVNPGEIYPLYASLKSVFGWGRDKVHVMLKEKKIRRCADGKTIAGAELFRLANVTPREVLPTETNAAFLRRNAEARKRNRELV